MPRKVWSRGAVVVVVAMLAATGRGANTASAQADHSNGSAFPTKIYNEYYAGLAERYLSEIKKAANECRKGDFDHNLRNLMALEAIAKQRKSDTNAIYYDLGHSHVASQSALDAAKIAATDAMSDWLKIGDLRAEASRLKLNCPERTAAAPQPPSCPTPLPVSPGTRTQVASAATCPNNGEGAMAAQVVDTPAPPCPPAGQVGALAQGTPGCFDAAASQNSLGVRVPKLAKPGQDDTGGEGSAAVSAGREP